MKTEQLTKQRIKASSNDFQIDKEKSDIEFWLKLITELLQHYDAKDVEFTDEELNQLIAGNFSDSTMYRLGQLRAAAVPVKQRGKTIQDFIDDASLYRDVFSTSYLYVSGNIQVKNGKAVVRKGAFEEIEERNSYYLTDEKSIELFERHRQLVADLNALKDEINANTNGHINTSYLVHFDATGSAYTPNLRYGS